MKLISFFVSVFFGCPIAASISPPYGNQTAPCIFTGSSGFDLLTKRNTSCRDLILSDLLVPGGVTLNLDKLKLGSTVTFNGPIPKPKFFQVHKLVDSVIEGITIVNAPVHVFSINGCKNLTLKGVTIDNKAGDATQKEWDEGKGGRNTDAFDVGGSEDIKIERARDDCVVVNSGTNIIFRNGLCSGGHGLSIGSVGGRSDNTVQNVLFENSVIADSENGARIKTKHSTTGLVSNVTYRNVMLQNITKYGIVVDQSYSCQTRPNGVSITGFTLVNVTGTVLPTGTNIFVNCGDGSCKQLEWKGVDVKGGKKSSTCLRIPSGSWC
ncbi:glycosyl hydrolases family 28-domain-containing protein [Copromyces sp. CBS 386.78]|nr:glycosyl hydrolases family 28-domain-containing protein [Copromyces sp. CBS 386.78]